MAHPYRFVPTGVTETFEQRRFVCDDDIGATELAGMTTFDAATQLLAHRHLAVADTKDGHAHLEHLFGCARATFFVHAAGSAREDDGARFFGQRGVRLVERNDLAIDAGFAHAAGDQLSDL